MKLGVYLDASKVGVVDSVVDGSAVFVSVSDVFYAGGVVSVVVDAGAAVSVDDVVDAGAEVSVVDAPVSVDDEVGSVVSSSILLPLLLAGTNFNDGPNFLYILKVSTLLFHFFF